MLKLQEYFDKLKLELHLLGLEIDDEFEKIEGKPIDIRISGGEGNLNVSFGYPGDRRTYKGMRPDELALNIYTYMQRRAQQHSHSTMGKPYGEVVQKITKPVQQPLPNIPQPKPQRRVFNLGPSSLPEKPDHELTLDEFAAKYPEGVRMLRQISIQLRKLDQEIAAWHL